MNLRRKSSKVSRQGTNAVVTGVFRDRWRKPAGLKIVKCDPSEPVVSGDVVESLGSLWAIAEVAWDAGWRPAGLAARVGKAVEDHKLPLPEDGW